MIRITLIALLLIGAVDAQISGFAAREAISRENRLRADSIVASGVDLGSGAFILEPALMSVEGSRDVTFIASHNSIARGSSGAMGPGWTHPYDASLTFNAQTVVTVHWDRNHRNDFEFAGAGAVYRPIGRAAIYDKLRQANNGEFKLVTFDGTRYDFLGNGILKAIWNKIGQRIEVGRDNAQRVTALIEPESNRRISLNYSPLLAPSRLQHLQDAEDRIVFLDYDSLGRLAKVYSPATLGFTQGANFPSLPIPDNDPNGVTHIITVSDNEPIGLVLLQSATMNHSRPQDLRLRLTSPSGASVNISPGPVDNGKWDLTGLLLSEFNGENPLGDWRVQVRDTAAGSEGFLNTFRLVFTEPTSARMFLYNPAGQITMVLGPDGERILANQYDGQGRVIAQDDGIDTNEPARFSYEQRPDGGLTTRYTDRIGNTSVYVHDANYNLLSVTDPLGATVTYTYDADGNRIRSVDALQRATELSYDFNGNLNHVVDPGGAAWRYDHDGLNNLTLITDPNGADTQFVYDGNNNLVRVRDAMGHQDVKSYGPNSQMSSSLLSDGGGMSFDYDKGQVSLASHPDGGRVGGSRSRYDNIGRPTRLTDGDGHSVTMRYNSRSQVIEKGDQLGRVERREFDRRGRRVGVIDPRGGETRYAYDGNDNVTALTDPLGRVTRYQYDGEDRLVRVTDPAGAETTYTYDALGRQLSETNADDRTVRREYDAVGNLVAQYDGSDIPVETMTYDNRDLPIRVVDAEGAVIEMEYDQLERLTKITDPLGRETRFAYDVLGRVTGVTDALGRTATRTYQQDDVIDRFEDARGGLVNFGYDNTNRIRRVSFPWGGSILIKHNNRDLETLISYPSGRKLEFGYNNSGLLSALFRTTLAGAREPNTFFDYDDNNNLVEVRTKAPAETQFRTDSATSFDELNRVTSHTDLRGDTIGYSYDAAGNLARITYPDGKTVRYDYDAAQRLTQVTDWANRNTRYFYDVNDQVIRVDLPNGIRRMMEYDDAGQITRRRELSPAGLTIVDFRYSYDQAGQLRVASSGARRAAFSPQPATMTYSRFSDQLSTFNGQPVTYDRDGNLTRGPLGGSMADFTYDVGGNLVAAGAVAYTYDASDRLVAFRDSSGETRLTVNPATEFPQTLLQTAPNGTVTRYVWGLGLIYEEKAGQIRVHHFDQAGSTIVFTDGGGSISGTVAYGPYGEIGATTGSADSLFLFNSVFGVITGPNGLSYMRFRWYSPDLKRFLTPDGVYGEIEDLSTLNLYAFAGSNPVLRADPNGEFWNLIIGAIVGLVVQAVSDAIQGRTPRWEEYLFAGLAGAAGAGIVGRFTGIGVKAAAGAAFGFAEGVGGETLAQNIRPEVDVDPGQVLLSGLIGAAGGALGGAGKGAFARRSAQRAAKRAASQELVRKAGRAALRRRGRLRVRINNQPKIRLIPKANAGGRGFTTQRPRGVRFAGLTTAQARALNSKAGVKGGFSGLVAAAKKDAAIARKLNRLTAPLVIAPRGPRAAIRVQGRLAVNSGRKNVAGEHALMRRFESNLAQSGRPRPNAPRRTSSAF